MEELHYVEIGLDALFLCNTSANLETFINVKSPAQHGFVTVPVKLLMQSTRQMNTCRIKFIIYSLFKVN